MFSRLCKNINLNVSSINNSNLLVNNRTTRREITEPHSLDAIELREPPPSYLEHYNHPVIRNNNASDSIELPPSASTASAPQGNVTNRLGSSASSYIVADHQDHNVRPDLVIVSETINNTTASSSVAASSSPIEQIASTNNIEIADIVESITKFKILNELEKNETYGADSVNYNVMGQNLSSRKPSLSLTWLLRDQQNQPHSQQQQSPHHHKQDYNKSSASSIISVATTTQLQHHHQRKKSRSRNRDRLFSEKYVSENNLTKFNNDKIINNEKVLILPKTNHVNENNNNNINAGDVSVRYKSVQQLDKLKNYNRSNVNSNIQIQVNGVQIKSDQQSQGLKYTYSEPSLYTAQTNDGAHSTSSKKHRHRKKREKYRTQNFGYEIKNVDEFLSKCSLSSPGNIPVVLSSQSILYQTRPGGYQMEIHLPLGMIVNAVFKNENWLYVQTPHAEEGYVSYDACLPLGILPQNQSSTQRQQPCWESNGDVFPRACGNMTDSEKELQLRGGTKSEGRPTPRLKRSTKTCSEKKFDTLYLRTTTTAKPKIINQSFISQTTKLVNNHNKYLENSTFEKAKSEYGVASNNRMKYDNIDDSKSTKSNTKAPAANGTATGSASQSNSNCVKSVRQILLAITEKYVTDSISVQKGEVVTLLFKEEIKQNYRHWFYIRKRDGKEGYIPAKVAGHGFL